MREIKFRGKLINSNEWAEGNLIVRNNGIAIISPDETVLGKYGQVDPGTVGQYTGLKDKNGIDVWEGDILRAGDYPRDKLTFAVTWYDERTAFNTFGINANAFDVIGSIHDETELKNV